MKINDKKCVTVDEVKKHFKHPVFWKIDDGDEATIKFYKNNGIFVARIRFANGIRHYFAIFEADSQADADERNREFNRMSRKEARDEEKQRKHEISYEVMRERGFDVAQSRRKSDPAEIAAYNEVLKALNEAKDKLMEEKRKLCRMIEEEIPERQMAEELGIPQSTLNGRKKVMLKDLQNDMKDYR